MTTVYNDIKDSERQQQTNLNVDTRDTCMLSSNQMEKNTPTPIKTLQKNVELT